MIDINKVYLGDCLEVMNVIDDRSIDMILCDLPFAITACVWDCLIPFDNLWKQYKRILKTNGLVALFGCEPFSSYLRISNIDWYKYDWIWEKPQGVDPFMASIRPLNNIENVSIFYKEKGIYNPQMEYGKPYHIIRDKTPRVIETKNQTLKQTETNNVGERFPKRILRFNQERGLHPTQKPVPLFEYLIKTYTNEDDLVLDNCAGSGTTGIACLQTNRNFILIEKDETYYRFAKERIENHMWQNKMF